MSLALVTETAREVRRLAAAGSDLARGDFRLERLREPLAASGAKVPVFGKIAEAIGALTAGDAPDTPDRLLSLATLVNAVLATQAETGVAGVGELRPLATTPAPGRTTAPFRQLEPVLTALSTTGSGRLEIVKNAFEQGHFQDLRLAAAAVRGLGDPAADIATFMADTVVPALGPAVAPLLRAGLDLQGAKAHARRLQLLARFVGPAENALYREAAENGSKEVKIEAVAALRHDSSSVPMLRAMARKGSKEVRAAALRSLAHLDPEGDIPLLVEILCTSSGDDVALPAVRANPSPALTAALVTAGRAVLQTVLATPKDKVGRAVDCFETLLQALGARPDAEDVTTFLGECLEQANALRACVAAPGAKFHGWLPTAVAQALLTVGTPRALGMLAGVRGRFDELLLGPVFRAAVACQTPTEVFDGFAHYLTGDVLDERNAILEGLRGLVSFQPAFRVSGGTNLPHQANDRYGEKWFSKPEGLRDVNWDPRWRARLMELDGWSGGMLGAVGRVLRGASSKKASNRIFEVHEIVAALTIPDDAAALRYLEAQLGHLPPTSKDTYYGTNTTWYGEALVLLGLIQGGHPKAAELVIESARRVAKLPYAGYQPEMLREVAERLPLAGLETLNRLARDLPEGDMRTYLLSIDDTPTPAVP